jgi:hypothetical protein
VEAVNLNQKERAEQYAREVRSIWSVEKAVEQALADERQAMRTAMEDFEARYIAPSTKPAAWVRLEEWLESRERKP